MPFTHDTEVALAAAAALVNTAHDGSLSSVAELDEFVRLWGWTGTRRRNRAELAEVHALRPRLELLWHVDQDGAVSLVNALLRDAGALPQLVRHDEYNYHIHATSSEAPLADRMAVEAAMAVVDVIRAQEFDRLRVCAAPDCDDVVVDLSRNRSRNYCSTRCSNRVNVAAFRARHR